MAGKHISYSEWKNWYICPQYHKLTYIDKINAFDGNIYTAFGKALHEVCEVTMVLDEFPEQEVLDNHFKLAFVRELKALPRTEQRRAVNDFKLSQWKQQGLEIAAEMFGAMEERFGKFGKDWVVLAAEEQLMVPIQEFELEEKYFKGFIDLVVMENDGKIHLIDWKTSSWGWDARKKSNKVLAYQLVMYKKFWEQKHRGEEQCPTDLGKIEAHFVLFKRTAKVGQKIEFVRVPIGVKRMKNATDELIKALTNIVKENYIKKRTVCVNCSDRFGQCEFYKTEHCK